MRPQRALVVGVVWCLLSVPAVAQQAITNADIVKMVKAGLSESIIVSMIESAPTTSFELTPDALIRLKTDGVTDKALAAMMAKASRPSATNSTIPAPATPAALEVVVPENTELTLRLVKAVTSANARVEDKVDLEVARDVVVDGYVVFRKGAPAKGTVTSAANARSFGRSGNLAFSIENVEAVNGQTVRLNTSRSLKGQTRAGATVAAVVLVGVFGGFVKGKNIEVPAGTEYVTYTVGDRRLNLAAVPPAALMPTSPQSQQPQFAAASGPTLDSRNLLGEWKVTLPNTTATVTQGPAGKLLISLKGQYPLEGEVAGADSQYSGTMTNACMPGRPVVMIHEANGWTVRTEFGNCATDGAIGRISFRMTR